MQRLCRRTIAAQLLTGISVDSDRIYFVYFCNTVLCKSNANDNRWISRFVLAISRWYISDKSHGLANAKTINQREIGTIFAISRRDIGLARICCNDISQSETIYHHDISCSEVRCNDISWWSLLQRFIIVKRLCTMNSCLCTDNGHSRVISGSTKLKSSLQALHRSMLRIIRSFEKSFCYDCSMVVMKMITILKQLHSYCSI